MHGHPKVTEGISFVIFSNHLTIIYLLHITRMEGFMALGKKYNTGVVWQDFQHRQLMDLFFKVKEAKNQKDTDKDVFKYSLAFLAMYVNHHFQLEEEYMDIYVYPESSSHKQEHKEFIKKIKYFRKTYSESDEKAIDKLLVTINNWILEHILGDDKKLGQHIISCEKDSYA